MSISKLPEPLTCDEVRRLLGAFARDELDVERDGRVEGHLSSCDDCPTYFADFLDRAAEAGELKLPAPPPFRMPVLASEFQRGAVEGLAWSAVGSSVRSGHEIKRLGERGWGRLTDELTEISESFRQAIESWALATTPPMPVRTRGPVPPTTGARAAGQLEAIVLDEDWQPTGIRLGVAIDKGPSIGRDGTLCLVVSGAAKQIDSSSDAALVCTLEVARGQRVRFQAKIVKTAAADRWSARFDDAGLPFHSDRRERNIPLEALKLFLLPTV